MPAVRAIWSLTTRSNSIVKGKTNRVSGDPTGCEIETDSWVFAGIQFAAGSLGARYAYAVHLRRATSGLCALLTLPSGY